MGWKVDDTWLWLGLGAFAFVAVQGVAYALRDISDLTLIRELPPEKQSYAISQETEDALNAQSLAVLAESHDRATSEAAIHILADRFCRDQPAITSLTRDLYSIDPETRARGRVLLKMLERYSSDTGSIQFLLDARITELMNEASLSNRDFAAQLREHEESFEEQELRRRRREAVVFHEGGGPISQDDIIQRRVDDVPSTVNEAREAPQRTYMEQVLRDMTNGTT